MRHKRTTEGPRAITRHRRGRSVAVLVVTVACLAAAGITGLALANTKPTLGSARNSTLGETIVVDSHGLTVYELSPETIHHLLCTKANGCFTFWPPVTVRSAKTKLTASGVKGKLGILHRNGFFQLTLAGRPLYHYAGDGSKRGSATGQGLRSFAGRWHIVTASDSQPAPPPTMSSSSSTTTSTTTSTTSSPGYGY
jgi:predicted lipoprotein with Yx(FWY)xxD motif